MALSTIPFSALSADASNQGVNFRNLIINGDMSIAQRGTSTSGITGNGYHTIDRMDTVCSLGTWTQSQSTDVPTGQGFAKSLKMDCTTANASPSTANTIRVRTILEGQNLQSLKKGTSNAESITLSFWVKSNKTGTYIAEPFDTDNSRHIGQAYTINSANTWEKKTLTFAGDTTGTINNDNGGSFEVTFWLGSGSQFTSGTLQTSWGSQTNANRAVGQVNLGDTVGNNWYITGVQLEVGTSASDFEFLPYDVNFDRCMRYYFEEGGDDPKGFVAIAFGASDSPFRYEFKKPMRAAPTGSYAGIIDNDIALYHNGNWRTLTAMSFTSMTKNGARVEINSAGAFSTGQGGHVYLLNGVGKFKFDAEL